MPSFLWKNQVSRWKKTGRRCSGQTGEAVEERKNLQEGGKNGLIRVQFNNKLLGGRGKVSKRKGLTHWLGLKACAET